MMLGRNTVWCAIHQPNFFPRLGTTLKLIMSDVWVSMSHVQFAQRDYQHRCRISDRHDRNITRWCTIPVHRPQGQSTRICDLEVVTPKQTADRIERTLKYHYAESPGWHVARGVVSQVAELLSNGDLVGASMASGVEILKVCGWNGRVLSDMHFSGVSRTGRLVALTQLSGSSGYLCGSGGARYLDGAEFQRQGIVVRYVQMGQFVAEWDVTDARRLSALDFLCRLGLSKFLESLNDNVERRVPGPNIYLNDAGA